MYVCMHAYQYTALTAYVCMHVCMYKYITYVLYTTLLTVAAPILVTMCVHCTSIKRGYIHAHVQSYAKVVKSGHEYH